MALTKTARRLRIKRRIRRRIHGTQARPRMSVFRSNKDIYVQFVNDDERRTICSVSSRTKEMADLGKMTKIEQAKHVGKKAAELAKAQGIEAVVFDRNGYQYHGRVRALADAAREGGLNF